MIQQCKIQAGDIILDAEIDIENKIPVEEMLGWSLHEALNLPPLKDTEGELDPNKTVEGSIARPITDEGRLLK